MSSGEIEGSDTAKSPMVERADRYFFWGIILCGSFILGPIGLVLLIIGTYMMLRAQQSGEAIRPWAVTIFGVFCMVDASINFVGWGLEILWSHDTSPVRTLYAAYGRLFDGGYYIDFNSTSLGGTAAVGEKALGFMAVFVVFPMRIVAGWAFLKMRRWGLQLMVITSFLYFMLWFGYMVNLGMNFNFRFGGSLYGVWGYWLFNIWYIAPFIMVPYLYTVNRELFTE